MKTKSTFTLGKRNFEILTYLADQKVHRFQEINKAFNLNRNGIFLTQLLQMGLLDKPERGRYKINKDGLWFVKFLNKNTL